MHHEQHVQHESESAASEIVVLRFEAKSGKRTIVRTVKTDRPERFVAQPGVTMTVRKAFPMGKLSRSSLYDQQTELPEVEQLDCTVEYLDSQRQVWLTVGKLITKHGKQVFVPARLTLEEAKVYLTLVTGPHRIVRQPRTPTRMGEDAPTVKEFKSRYGRG